MASTILTYAALATLLVLGSANAENRRLLAPALAPTAASTSGISHVLLISVDGLHQIDLARYIQSHPNSAMANLTKTGITYSNATIDGLSDSFPGLLSLVAGATSKYTGVYYDVSYDRTLSLPGSGCNVTGAEVAFDESDDFNKTQLYGSINPENLPLNKSAGCTPVYPHSFLKVNTIFEVAKANGGYTAWSDKHNAYDLVNGPSGKGVDDLFTPEIASDLIANTSTTFQYDMLHVNACINWIKGLNYAGNATKPVPTIFGFNMQTLSVSQKLKGAGYLDAAGTPSTIVATALDDIDAALANMTAALSAAGLSATTAVIITAKHGQSPIDPKLLNKIDDGNLTDAINAIVPGEPAYIIADDVALVWLNDSSMANMIVEELLLPSNSIDLGIDSIVSGDAIQNKFGGYAERVPDFIIKVKKGVIYTTGSKIMEHGGLSDDDRHVGLLISNPAFTAANITTGVYTRQVAPSILSLLGLPTSQLQGAVQNGTPVLPGLTTTAGTPLTTGVSG